MQKEVIVRNGGPVSISLSTLGIITGIVLCILKAAGPLSHISWFWATFPFWIVPAVTLAFVLLIGIITLIGVIIALIFSK